MTVLSVLDVASIPEGSDVGTALRNTVDLAQHVERWGYRRFWLAEHHNMPGIASAATAVVIGQVAAATSTIRVGAGGVMLPNHAPLVVAEQFGTLEALFPGRIDLGLGRAPGTDGPTMRALRRHLTTDADAFPREVVELLSYLAPATAEARVRAYPGQGSDVPVWILGSSLFGAQLAAALGLPFAFASHFAPAALTQALAIYRTRFQPSARWAKPHVAIGVNVVAAETADEAHVLRTSVLQAFVSLRRGNLTRLPRPMPGFLSTLTDMERAMLDETLAVSVVGDAAAVGAGLRRLADRTGADELIVTTQIHDHAARLRSFELAAAAWAEA